MKKKIIRLLAFVFVSPFIFLAVIYLNYQFISWVAADCIYNDSSRIPYRKHTMVLGSGRSIPGVWKNHSFEHRMEAVVELYRNKKTDVVVASGISNRIPYNEPNDMKEYLVAAGLPAHVVYPDHGGNRTFRSVERLKTYYKVDQVIIVSQTDQLERALFYAKFLGIDAIGFRAKPVPYHHRFWKIREYLSRMRVIGDCIAFWLKIY